jgi:hypothetical protein
MKSRGEMVLSIVLVLLFVLVTATGCTSTNSQIATTTAVATTAAAPTASSLIGTVVIAEDPKLAALTTSENGKTLTFMVDSVVINYVVSSGVTTISDFLSELNTALDGVATVILDGGNHLLVTSVKTGADTAVKVSGDASAAFMGLSPIPIAGTD